MNGEHWDSARHVIGCRFTQETVLQNVCDDVASTIHQSLENGSWFDGSGFYGYNLITWLIVINFSFSGLFVSWLQKFADTIVKVGRCRFTQGAYFPA